MWQWGRIGRGTERVWLWSCVWRVGGYIGLNYSLHPPGRVRRQIDISGYWKGRIWSLKTVSLVIGTLLFSASSSNLNVHLTLSPLLSLPSGCTFSSLALCSYFFHPVPLACFSIQPGLHGKPLRLAFKVAFATWFLAPFTMMALFTQNHIDI